LTQLSWSSLTSLAKMRPTGERFGSAAVVRKPLLASSDRAASALSGSVASQPCIDPNAAESDWEASPHTADWEASLDAADAQKNGRRRRRKPRAPAPSRSGRSQERLSGIVASQRKEKRLKASLRSRLKRRPRQLCRGQKIARAELNPCDAEVDDADESCQTSKKPSEGSSYYKNHDADRYECYSECPTCCSWCSENELDYFESDAELECSWGGSDFFDADVELECSWAEVYDDKLDKSRPRLYDDKLERSHKDPRCDPCRASLEKHFSFEDFFPPDSVFLA